MIKKLIKLPKRIINKFSRLIKYNLNKKTYCISSDLENNVLFKIKDESFEDTIVTRVFNLRNGGHIGLFHDSVFAYQINDCVIIPENDFVLTDNKALYKKSKHPMFGHIKTQDRNIIKIYDNKMDVYIPKNSIDIDYGFDLCGTNSNAWSHFIVQFLPKLYFLPKLKSFLPDGKKISILLDDFCDEQIVKIVKDYISQFDFAEIHFVSLDCCINCSSLFHIDNVSFISDFDAITTNSDIVIPCFVAKMLKENLCNAYPVNINNSFERVFITRKSTFRNITNYKEVEDFFKEKGYVLFDPGAVSLSEKIEVFKNAHYIVGPSSSGFSNLIFCDKAKVLRMCNSQRINDGYFPFIAGNWNIDGMCLIGKDINPYNSHSSYYIDMEDLKKVCETEGF